MEPCIEKGCLEDPWPIEQMYINTKVQPITGLQERLKAGETNRNEARHRVLNEIVQSVARVNQDLMEAFLDFAIYFTNRKYDALFGRLDEHSLSLFAWDDALLDADAAELLDGPPLFPAAAVPRRPLPPVEFVPEGHPCWEPMGFRYLAYLHELRDRGQAEAAVALAAGEAAEMEVEALAAEADEDNCPPLMHRIAAERAAERTADITAAALTAAAYSTAAAPATPPRGSTSGGVRTTGAGKAKALTIETTSPIKPARPGELHAMVAALREARETHAPNSAAMYEAARASYLQRVELAYADRSSAPDALYMRPAPTSAALLKEVAEGNVRYALRVEQERERGGSSADPIIALPAPEAIGITSASPTAATSSPAPSTGLTAAAPPTFDFRAALPPQLPLLSLGRKEKKAYTDKALYERRQDESFVVQRNEVQRLQTWKLNRLALKLGVSRTRGPTRGYVEMRAEVLASWPSETESVSVP